MAILNLLKHSILLILCPVVKGMIYSVAIAMVISSPKITCYFHMWRYDVFMWKLTWYCIGVYIISDRIQSNIVIAERRHPLGNSYCKGSRLEWSHGSCKKNFCGKQKNLSQNTVEHGLMTSMFPWQHSYYYQMSVTTSLKGVCCGCPVQFVNFSNNASLCAMKLIVNDKFLVDDSERY